MSEVIHEDKAPDMPITYALLKCERPTYFVVEVYGNPDITEEEIGHKQYYYDEHTCPTNWLKDVVSVIQDGEMDPHGFAEFVRLAKGPKDGLRDRQEIWDEIFPEVDTPTTQNETLK